MNIKLMPLTSEMVERTSNKYRMRSTLETIKKAYEEDESGMVVGQCKSLLESFFKSILDEFNKPAKHDEKFPKLAKDTVKTLEIGKNSAESGVHDAYVALIGSLSNNINTAAQSIGTLRTKFCPMAHGRSVYHEQLDMSYALFIAQQADSLVWFIYELRARAIAPKDQDIVQDQDLDNELNETYDSLEMMGDLYFPAEVLYQINPQKYHDALLEHRENKEGLDD